MKKWYSDKDMAIFFSVDPDARIRYPKPDMTEEEYEDVCSKPFICKNRVIVTLYDLRKDKRYAFSIPKNYTWDGATIPALFWRVIGSKTDERFLIPSMLHDRMCERHEIVGYDRYFADKVFERCLYVSRVPAFKRWMMFHGVDNYQKFQGWKK